LIQPHVLRKNSQYFNYGAGTRVDEDQHGGHERANGLSDGGHDENEEDNTVAVAATSAVTKVNPMPPSGFNQMNHPTSAMIWEVWVAPIMCKFKMSTPSRHMAGLPTYTTQCGAHSQ